MDQGISQPVDLPKRGFSDGHEIGGSKRMTENNNRNKKVAEARLLLEKEIELSPSSRLPPVRELSRKFGITESVIASAAHILRERGIISFSRGRPMVIVSRMRPVVVDRRSAVVEIAQRLRRRILLGEWQTGRHLPKVLALTNELRVSNTTLLAAFDILRGENIIHKTGKNWIVGPLELHQGDRKVRPATEGPIILILQSNFKQLERLAESERTRLFFSAFENEVVRYGIQLRYFFTKEDGAPPSPGTVGKNSLRKLFTEQGSRILGTLLVDSRGRLRNLNEWIEFMLTFQRPVVWFDYLDDSGVQMPLSSNFTRCHFHEESAIETAINSLAALNHRETAYLLGGTDEGGWRRRRGMLLAKHAEKHGMKMHFVEASGTDPLPAYMEKLADRFAPGGDLANRWKPAEYYLPVIGRALKYKEVTAWIAPRDQTAYHLFWWMQAAGLGVPEDISLLSFDNRHARGVSSIDFGFGYLGYAAFHSIFGIIKLRRCRGGRIPNRPYLLDRGTIGWPRTGSLPSVLGATTTIK